MEDRQKRKGARSIKDIPLEILDELNQGRIASANLVEWLAIDQRLLLQNFLQQTQRTHYFLAVSQHIERLKKQTVNTMNEAIGEGLLAQMLQHKDNKLQALMQQHASDAVRGWASYLIGKNEQLSLSEKLAQIQVYATDAHFGVREVAWMALRPSLAKNLSESIKLLEPWSVSEDENIRRFASEATRPRGVWCMHIEALKQNPALALPILSPLKNDSSRYVQNSVGNWLNDAGKTCPDFVKDICAKWAVESPTQATAYIVKRAMRNFT